MRKTRRTFSKDFKREAVLLSDTTSVREAAETLNISPELIYKWRQALKNEGADAFRGRGNRTTLEEEIRQLKRQVKLLKEEKEILKKASVYFAAHLR